MFPLLPPDPGLYLDRIEITDQAVTLFLRTTAPAVPCPRCAQPARQVHSRYTRYARSRPARHRRGRLVKTIKRQMVGRAGLPLLRARVLPAG